MSKHGWTYKKLGDCFSYIKNGANIKQIKNAQGLPITRIETLSGGIFNRNRLGYADIFDEQKYSSYYLNNHDILMSHINSKQYIGRAVLYQKLGDEKIIHGMNLLRLVPIKDIIFSPFIVYYFSSFDFKRNIARIRKDAVNQSSFTTSDLKNIHIPVPPLAEQESIVAELDEINETIAELRQQIADLDTLAQSTFYDMFGDPVTNPKGWEVKKLGDVCFPKNKISRAKKTYETNDVINYIDISSINNDTFKIDSLTEIRFGDAPSRAQQVVKENDILVSLVRPNLKNIAIVTKGNNLVASSGFCVIRPKEAISKNLIFFHVTSKSFTDYLLSRVTGANYPAVREDDIMEYKIPIPPLALQHDFASRVEDIEEAKAELNAQIAEMQTLLASRMDYYFD